MSDAVSRAGARLDALLARIRHCRVCRDAPTGGRLPHEPRPVVRAAVTARIAVCGQAPGVRVHASGVPFSDPSGVRLRSWMGVSEAEFYDERMIAVVPMGFCFPGLDANGGDLPPRRECARRWRSEVFALLPQVELILAVGRYALDWHLGHEGRGALGPIVRRWREPPLDAAGRRVIALPHPSWRNNAWLKANPWFAAELVPELQGEIRSILERR